jgi:hypothetical protein
MKSDKEQRIAACRLCARGWTPLPNFFPDFMFGLDLPATFWVFTITLWRNAFGGKDPLQEVMNDLNPLRRQGARIGYCELALSQFNMSRETAGKWAAAYSVSEIVSVQYANRLYASEGGSTYGVNFDASYAQWAWFLYALEETLKGRRKPKSIQEQMNGTEDFRLLLKDNLIGQKRNKRAYTDEHFYKSRPTQAGNLGMA